MIAVRNFSVVGWPGEARLEGMTEDDMLHDFPGLTGMQRNADQRRSD
jgi:hypothetical protein